LHDRADKGVLSVRDGIDVDLDRTLEEAVYEHRPVDRAEISGGVADAHCTPSEDVRRPDQPREADRFRHCSCLGIVMRDPPFRTADPEPVEQGCEAFAILCEVDRLEWRSHDPEARRL